MERLDLKRSLPDLYKPSAKHVSVVDVPPLSYLMLDGTGDPNTSAAFAAATQALFTLSYALKFAVKRSEQAIDYTVMPLEGLWWADDMATFSVERKADWQWTLMILQPDLVNAELVEEIRAQTLDKKKLDLLKAIRFEEFHEGKAAQIMHIGPFAAEGPNIERVHAQIEAAGGKLSGKHHEIYLSDFRKANPATMKTIIRQPMI